MSGPSETLELNFPAGEIDAAAGADALDRLDFAKGDGLIPAVVQDVDTGRVLMLGYMNREALAATLARGRVVLFSRSKRRLWEKGETSGNHLTLVKVCADCDRDAVLVLTRPQGPTCHLGTRSCFGAEPLTRRDSFDVLHDLEHVIAERMLKRPTGSYTTSLFENGIRRIAQKVGEESLEVALAAAGGSDQEVIAESSDLVYHLMVLLHARGLSLDRVMRELRERRLPTHAA